MLVILSPFDARFSTENISISQHKHRVKLLWNAMAAGPCTEKRDSIARGLS